MNNLKSNHYVNELFTSVSIEKTWWDFYYKDKDKDKINVTMLVIFSHYAEDSMGENNNGCINVLGEVVLWIQETILIKIKL